MKNKTTFDEFIATLTPTNRTLDFYVDWQKCLHNRADVEIFLNHLNFLLGKNDDELQKSVEKLFASMPKAFTVLPLLVAVRDANQIVFDTKGNQVPMTSYFENAERAFEFIKESGLAKIFSDRNIKDLNDFVFGIEVGLDTNARKNRSGQAMEKLISNIFSNAKLNFSEQVNIGDLTKISKIFGDDIKRFDFVIFADSTTYCIECNFYSSGGSKLNETARAYQELAQKFEKIDGFEFIWITDGEGWLSAKSKLSESYKTVEIYNLSNLQKFIDKITK